MTGPRKTDDLLPCPFCGSQQSSKAIVIEYRKTLDENETKAYRVQCIECGADTLTAFVMQNERHEDAKARAIDRWNRRDKRYCATCGKPVSYGEGKEICVEREADG